MADKPNLTLEQALKEFPKECKAVIQYSNGSSWVEDMQFKLGVGMLAQPEDRARRAGQLGWAALNWLAGKEVLQDSPPGSGGLYVWSKDPLRALLEEVREHLKESK